MINSGSEISDDESDSNICIMQFDPEQVTVPISTERTDLTINGPPSSTSSSSRYQSPFHEVGLIESCNEQILNEIQNLVIENLQFENGESGPSYVCKYIFDGARLEKLLIGKNVMKPSDQYEVLFTETGSSMDGISPDDIFIRSGHFARLVKNHIFDVNPTLLKRKFGETSTYSKTFKLGFKIVFKDPNKRSIGYVNLIEALSVIGRELGNKSDVSESGDNESTQGDSSVDTGNVDSGSFKSMSLSIRSDGNFVGTSNDGASSLPSTSSSNSSSHSNSNSSSSSSSSSYQNTGDKVKKRKIFKSNQQFIHLPTQTAVSSQSSQSSYFVPPTSIGMAPMPGLNTIIAQNHSNTKQLTSSTSVQSSSSQLNISNHTATMGLHYLEYEAEFIEDEISDILDKLDLLKSQDLFSNI